MARLLLVALIAILVCVTGCGHYRATRRSPEGTGTSITFESRLRSGTCWVMTLTPALQSVTGSYSTPEVACYVLATAQAETQPLYHLQNQSTSDHLYTTRASEISEAAQWGYALHDTCCYVYSAPAPGRVPLYRLNKPGVWCHFYTTDEGKRDMLVAVGGFRDEGVACYVPAEATEGTRVLFRMKRKSGEVGEDEHEGASDRVRETNPKLTPMDRPKK